MKLVSMQLDLVTVTEPLAVMSSSYSAPIGHCTGEDIP
jgi:hypothetical protein